MTDERHKESAQAEQEMEEAIEAAEPAADEMEERSEQLEEKIEETGRDWERKRQDESVPGAQPDLGEVETHRDDVGKSPDES